MLVDGNVRCGMTPVLEEFVLRVRIGNQRTRMRTEACKEWQFLAANKNVDRIDLNQTNVIEHAGKISLCWLAVRAFTETLGDECDRTRLVDRQRVGSDAPTHDGVSLRR